MAIAQHTGELHLSDATLRDSAHMAGVELTPADTAAIAKLLVRTGIELVEVGMVSGPGARDADLVTATHDAIGPERSMTLVMVRDRRQVTAAGGLRHRDGGQTGRGETGRAQTRRPRPRRRTPTRRPACGR